MHKPRSTFLVKFDALIKKKGFNSITEFVNDWIQKGGSFKTMHDLVLLEGFKVVRFTVWARLREYLTVPFNYENEFWYRWDSLAKIRGKDTIIDWMKENRGKFTALQISREFDVDVRTIEKLIARIRKQENEEILSFRKTGDSDGFYMTDSKEKWAKILDGKGYKTIREAVKDMDDKGMSIADMARNLEVSYNIMQHRIKKIGFVVSNRRERNKCPI